MPDCVFKYKHIVKKAKCGKGKYKDPKFKPDNSSMGGTLIKDNLGGMAVKWYRMSEHKVEGKKCCLFQDGVDINDIDQGALGDCYFLSAIGVLGPKATKMMFYVVNSIEEW